ncbi:TetR family transcriptional regulator [Leucobacter sp. M11]|uniref:TetR family transcriptional regulator n=1 Tax=Leucobacter sp. M11 TaxID=2993565 RepID=UPI002D7FFE1A|nr:TetR family transcriptional regulator [Leucobacter sp. M11]MEB4616489.1 TetR family transcriptional regulator [Leucobacter sp. M11]
MTDTTRTQILTAALGVIAEGGTVSLESAARAVGLSKPGLMYHFPTKQALMLGLVDHVVEAWHREITSRLPAAAPSLSGARARFSPGPRARLSAYLDWCLTGEFSSADLVMLTDPRLREPLTERWAERMAPWFALPEHTPIETRARLSAVRALADGLWFAEAAGLFPLPAAERGPVRELADALLSGVPE